MRSTHNMLHLRLSAAMIALLVLVPSLCSARCSSHLCMPAQQQTTGDACHHTSAPESPAGASFKTFAPLAPCTATEMVSVVPRSSSVVSVQAMYAASVAVISAAILLAPQFEAAQPVALNTSPPSQLSSSGSPLRI